MADPTGPGPAPVPPTPQPDPAPGHQALMDAAWRFVRMLVAVGVGAAIVQAFAAFSANPQLTPKEFANIASSAFIAAVIAAAGDYLRTWAGQTKAAMRGAGARVKARSITAWDKAPF